MKIYIEASSFYGKRSGVGRFSLSITKELVKLRNQDKFYLFNFVRPGKYINKDFSMPANVFYKFIRVFPGRAFSLLMRRGISVPLEFFGLWRADILIFPNFISWASIVGKKRVAIIHDLSYLHYPEFIQPKNLAYLKKQLPRTIHRSDRIVAVSESTKRDLIKHFGVKADEISVIYNAIDNSIFNLSAVNNADNLKKRYKLPDRYILFVGTIEPRKNLSGLLRAYTASFTTHKTPLVLVGPRGWNDTEIFEQLDLASHLPISLLDYVDEADLPAIYRLASLFVYPSFYEGFGIPLLESMASGCPVITSNVSSMPEVVEKAALTIDPTNIKALANAICQVLGNERQRQQMIKQGLQQVKKFSWQKSAAELSKVIDRVNHG